MTRGELNVVAVRALTLADELGAAILLGKLARAFGRRERANPFWIDGPDLIWASDRLLSTCERALGVRARDSVRARDYDA